MGKEKVSIVTGAASGIGFAVASAFAEDGMKVVMADVNEEKLKAAANTLGCDYYAADLSSREACKGLVDYTLKTHGKTDILVNVAGIQNVAAIEDFPEDRWDFMISLMLTAPFLLTKYVWNSMKEQQWGRIINLNSIHGLVASEYKAAYVSAKHGLMGLTKTAALEGGPYGITVNSICPAYVRTPLVDDQIEAQALNHGISKEEVVSKIMLQKSAIKTLLEPSTIAEVVKFLCSDAGNNITGSALTIDGGWTAA
ncbi:3-hydroxybutyrate dehydrogenase [Anoxybacterium hadale]|uniref:3-hydroxybutyrate dehydrogenase n=1 Tax=Anoxybacterium hadale TaxID=3408580 RepID=A0ACD1AA79_9FIRM|nr:3-hydroxybutyrate dehydrogenase [Clostridiales bacterium]